jgi:succinoglycan biosynthesis protein ExoA
VVIPVLNEQQHISECLRSVQAQDYPEDRIEIIVADGGSDDRTRSIVAAMATGDPRITLIDNPGRKQATGLNRAIAASRGEVIARLDGHAAWPPSHISQCVELLHMTGAANVGGTMDAIGETSVGAAIALATASPLGAGGARYRYADRVMETDTVFLGCFNRRALEKVGGYDEGLSIHEDYELNQRLRASGEKIVFSPEIPTKYWTRTSWKSLATQYFKYGSGKAQVAMSTPAVLRPYHLASPLLAASVPFVCAGMVSKRRRLTLLAITPYLGACIAAGWKAGRGAPPKVHTRVPFVFPVVHLAWGLGFWVGLLKGARYKLG